MVRETGTGKYEQLIARCKSLAPVTTAVVHPCERSALAGASEAAAAGLIQPIYVGPKRHSWSCASERSACCNRFVMRKKSWTPPNANC